MSAEDDRSSFSGRILGMVPENNETSLLFKTVVYCALFNKRADIAAVGFMDIIR